MVKHVKEIIYLILRVLDQFIVFHVSYLRIKLIFQKQDFQIGNTLKKFLIMKIHRNTNYVPIK